MLAMESVVWKKLRLSWPVQSEEERNFEASAGEVCRVRLGATLCVSRVVIGPCFARSQGHGVNCSVEIAPHACGKHNEEKVRNDVTCLAVESAILPVVAARRLPKARVDVRVVILAAAGGELAAAIVAASLALAARSVECTHLVPAGLLNDVTCATRGPTDDILLLRRSSAGDAPELSDALLARCRRAHAEMVRALRDWHRV